MVASNLWPHWKSHQCIHIFRDPSIAQQRLEQEFDATQIPFPKKKSIKNIAWKNENEKEDEKEEEVERKKTMYTEGGNSEKNTHAEKANCKQN